MSEYDERLRVEQEKARLAQEKLQMQHALQMQRIEQGKAGGGAGGVMITQDTQANAQARLSSDLVSSNVYSDRLGTAIGGVSLDPLVDKYTGDINQRDSAVKHLQGLYGNINRLKQDEGTVAKELEAYKINPELVNDPFAAQKVTQLADKFTADLNSNRSAIGMAQRNYETAQRMKEEFKTRITGGTLGSERASILEDAYLNSYQGVGAGTDGIYNSFEYKGPAEYVDVDKQVDEALKGMVASKVDIGSGAHIEQNNGSFFIRKSDNSIEAISYNKAYEVAKNSLQDDEKINSYLGEEAFVNYHKVGGSIDNYKAQKLAEMQKSLTDVNDYITSEQYGAGGRKFEQGVRNEASKKRTRDLTVQLERLQNATSMEEILAIEKDSQFEKQLHAGALKYSMEAQTKGSNLTEADHLNVRADIAADRAEAALLAAREGLRETALVQSAEAEHVAEYTKDMSGNDFMKSIFGPSEISGHSDTNSYQQRAKLVGPGYSANIKKVDSSVTMESLNKFSTQSGVQFTLEDMKVLQGIKPEDLLTSTGPMISKDWAANNPARTSNINDYHQGAPSGDPYKGLGPAKFKAAQKFAKQQMKDKIATYTKTNPKFNDAARMLGYNFNNETEMLQVMTNPEKRKEVLEAANEIYKAVNTHTGLETVLHKEAAAEQHKTFMAGLQSDQSFTIAVGNVEYTGTKQQVADQLLAKGGDENEEAATAVLASVDIIGKVYSTSSGEGGQDTNSDTSGDIENRYTVGTTSRDAMGDAASVNITSKTGVNIKITSKDTNVYRKKYFKGYKAGEETFRKGTGVAAFHNEKVGVFLADPANTFKRGEGNKGDVPGINLTIPGTKALIEILREQGFKDVGPGTTPENFNKLSSETKAAANKIATKDLKGQNQYGAATTLGAFKIAVVENDTTQGVMPDKTAGPAGYVNYKAADKEFTDAKAKSVNGK